MTAPAVSPIREYELTAKSSGVFGRVSLSVRQHTFLIDGPVQNGCPGVEITPPEAFLSAVAGCCVELVEVIAKETNVSIGAVNVAVYGKLDRSQQSRPNVTVFNTVTMKVTVKGTDKKTAAELVGAFQRRCPIYGTIATAVPDVRVDVSAG